MKIGTPVGVNKYSAEGILVDTFKSIANAAVDAKTSSKTLSTAMKNHIEKGDMRFFNDFYYERVVGDSKKVKAEKITDESYKHKVDETKDLGVASKLSIDTVNIEQRLEAVENSVALISSGVLSAKLTGMLALERRRGDIAYKQLLNKNNVKTSKSQEIKVFRQALLEEAVKLHGDGIITATEFKDFCGEYSLYSDI
ncbi:MAG: hypothetical protein QM504_08480 [Pseudomonadota bacterium]